MGCTKLLAAAFIVSLGSVVLSTACNRAEAPEPELTVTPSPMVLPTLPPQLTVSSPTAGAQVTAPITVEGRDLLGGSVSVAVRRKDDGDFCYTLVNTNEGVDGGGTFDVQMGFPPPSSATEAQIVVYNLKDSYNVISVPVTISPQKPSIVIDSPTCGAMVKSPVTIHGSVSSDVAGGDVVLVVKDAQGQELGRSNVMVDVNDDTASRDDFTATLSFSMPAASPNVGYPGTLEAFSTSPNDGSEMFLFSVPVELYAPLPPGFQER